MNRLPESASLASVRATTRRRPWRPVPDLFGAARPVVPRSRDLALR